MDELLIRVLVVEGMIAAAEQGGPRTTATCAEAVLPRLIWDSFPSNDDANAPLQI